MHTRVWPFGLGFGAPAGSGQLTQLDINVANSLDMAAGGIYAPAALIEFGGAGLKVSGPFLATGTAGFTGAVQFLGTAVCPTSFGFTAGLLSGDAFSDIRWDGIATFRTGAQLIGNAGAPLTWGGAATFNGLVAVNNSFQHLAGIAAFNAITNFGGATSFVAGSVTNQVPFANSGGGHIRKRVVGVPDANTTYADPAGTADVFEIPNLAAVRIYKLDHASAVQGQEVEFTGNLNTGVNAAVIQRMDGTGLTDIQNFANKRMSATFMFSGGVWKLKSYSLVTP